jgi:O-antigen/teichoic acid export membrane protein
MLKQTLLYLPAQLFGPLAMFVAAVVWTHLLDAETYGAVSLVLAAQELVYMLTIAWWSLYALRYRGAVEAERREKLVATDNAVVFAGAALQVIVAMPLLGALGVEPSPALLAASTVLFVTRSLLTHYSEIARSEQAIGTYTIAQLAGPLAGTLASFAGVKLFGGTTMAALVGIAGAQTLGLAWTMVRLKVDLHLRLPDRDVLRGAIAYGLPVILVGLLGWVSTNGIRTLVERMAGAEALGLVSVGWGLGQRVSSVAAMLLTAAAFPIAVKRFESGDEEGALQQLALNGSMLFGLLAPTCVGVTLVADRLVTAMIAEPYRVATIAVLPLAVLAGAIRNQRLHNFDQVFLLNAVTTRFIPVNVIEALGTTAGTMIGIEMGHDIVSTLVGATAGALFGTTLGAVITARIAIGTYRLRPQWGAWARILLACAAMAAVLRPIPWGAGTIALIVEIVVGIAVYGLALLALFPEIRALLRSRFGRRTA